VNCLHEASSCHAVTRIAVVWLAKYSILTEIQLFDSNLGMRGTVSFIALVLTTPLLGIADAFATPVRLPSRSLGNPVCEYHQVDVPTSQEGPPCQKISVEDLTPKLKELLSDSGMKNGVINVISRHTTTAITINERESRLARDLEETFLAMIPADERSHPVVAKYGVRYQHNDIDLRPESEEEAQRCRDNGWDIDDSVELQRWRGQEPINAHSHLISMMLGSSEGIPVVDGKMTIGQWQSVLLVDLDGPRDRTVGVQLLGYL
jgi:thiamine phosphate synthase YjbQ (UPF0047 family)